MPAIKNKEKILQLVNEVPEKELGKVVSLMEKLTKSPNEKNSEKYKAIFEIKGKFKDCLSSSEDFAKRKQEENY